LKSTALRHPNWWTEREQKQDSSPLPHLISGRARRNLMRLPDLKWRPTVFRRFLKIAESGYY